MEKIAINSLKPSKKEISAIARILTEGGVILYPTDTIYGFGCLATDKKAIGKIYRIKKKDKLKPLLILVSSLSMAKKYCRISKRHEVYLKNNWPGPLTAILDSRGLLPEILTGNSAENGLAVRLPDNGFLVGLIRRIGVPLVSTSANLSGEKPVTKAESFRSPQKPAIDAIIDGGELKGKASRIVDIRDMDDIIILRR